MHGFWAHVFDHPSARGAAEIAAKTAVVYVVLVIGLRLLGKRELGQMSLYDLVLIVILGNAVQNAMLNTDNTLGGGLIAVAALLALNWALNQLLSRNRRLEHLLVGDPVLIVRDGRVLKHNLARQGLTREQLDTALREHGIEDPSHVHMAVLEVDGTISVVPRDAPVLRTRRHYRGIRLP